MIYFCTTSTFFFFFFNDTATTEIYTLSLHDALPILPHSAGEIPVGCADACERRIHAPESIHRPAKAGGTTRSEEHTSELQSRRDLVCRLLLEKKNNKNYTCHARKQFIHHVITTQAPN